MSTPGRNPFVGRFYYRCNEKLAYRVCIDIAGQKHYGGDFDSKAEAFNGVRRLARKLLKLKKLSMRDARTIVLSSRRLTFDDSEAAQ